MTDFPDLKIKALVSFPAAVFGGTGLAVRQVGGQFYFDLAFDELAQISTIAAPVLPTTFLALWEQTQNTYRRISVPDLQAQIGGGAAPATAVPLIESGAGAVGISLKYAREDHVHPALGGGGGTPSDAPPLIDGVAAPGVSALYSRGDHVHPTDTTRAAVTAIREKLAAARTYFVRTDGNDANNGLVNNAGGAFLTLQKAYDVIVATLDLGGQTVTISSTGTFPAGLNLAGPWSGGGSVVFDGNGGAISASSGFDMLCGCALPGLFTVQNVAFASSGPLSGLVHVGTGTLRIGAGVTFGNMNGGDHIVSGAAGSLIACGTNYTITGACRIHLYAKLGGVIDMYAGVTGVTTTLAANITLAGGGAFAYAEAGGILQQIGSARTIALGAFGVTGQRYNVTGGSLINTQGAGATYFPGSIAGGGTGVYT